jgi:predicted dehydrogenase
MSTSTIPPLRIGVLGAANIARAFTRDVAGSPDIAVTAVASRQLEAAQRFATENHIPRAFGSYEALLADPDIDVVYNPLPNSLHAVWSIAAARAGKHVLCEKPLALDGDEARAMFDAARQAGVLLLEAYPYRFQPQTATMLELAHSGAIWRVDFVQASFGFTLPDPATNIRMQPDLGGGALLDAGSYPLSLIRLLMGEAPQRVSAEAEWASSGVDISLMAQLVFSGGRRAQLACSMSQGVNRQALIVGTEGTITTEFLNHTGTPGQPHPFGFLPSQMRLRRGRAGNIPFENVESASGSGFRFAAEAFAGWIRRRDTQAFEQSAQASIDIADTLAAMLKSAKTGSSVTLYTRQA